MAQGNSTQDRGLKFFRLKKIVTLDELALHMKCSTRTVQRRLAKWHAISSYNQNGSCYTLPDIAAFDADGLWRYRGVFFSRFGSLPETFVGLVSGSSAGLTAAEAGDLLGVRPSSFLWSLREHPALRREKHLGCYVYLCSDPVRYQDQIQQRSLVRGAVRLPTDAEAVAILIEKIQHPGLSDDELGRRLKKKRVFVGNEIIHGFFAHHGLAVKKTPRSA